MARIFGRDGGGITGMKASESIATLAKSLKEVQHQLKPIKKDKTNPFFKSKYADLESVVEGSKDILYKNGFSITQLISQNGGDSTLETILLHESGEWIGSEMRLYLPKTDPQGQGSAITYARRYAWSSIIGLVTEDEDDDGEKSSLASEKQVAMLKSIAFQSGIKSPVQWLDFLEEHFNVAPNQIPKDKVDSIKNLLEKGVIK